MKTIAIISQKGGAGKTTVAVHLAVAAESHNLKTAIFDLDPQASAASWSDKREKSSPAVVSAQATRLSNLLDQAAAQSADFVIIGSAPNAYAASLAAARAADLILIPCRPAAFDLNAIGTTLSLAAVANKPSYVLLNAVPSYGRVGEEARNALQTEGINVVVPVLHYLVAFSHAVNDGLTAQEYCPKSKASDEINTLFHWLLKESEKIDTRANEQTRKRANISIG
jgi:chromosome partitioning protein